MQYSGTNALHLGCLSRRPGPCPARAPSRDPARAGGVKVLGAEQGNASAHAIVAPAHHTRAVRVASRGRAGRGLRAAILPAQVGSLGCEGVGAAAPAAPTPKPLEPAGFPPRRPAACIQTRFWRAPAVSATAAEEHALQDKEGKGRSARHLLFTYSFI